MENESKFGKILSELITEAKTDNKDLASAIGVSATTVSRWRAGTEGIELPNLVALCKFFGCSLDYLIGRREHDQKPSNFNTQNFGKQIRKVMERHGISSYKFRKDTGLGGRILYDWEKGADPKLNTLIKLADYFKCSLDELVGLE